MSRMIQRRPVQSSWPPRRLQNHPLPQVWRFSPASRPQPTGERVRDDRLARLEAVLWLSEEPLAANKIALLCEFRGADEVRAGIETLRKWYIEDESPFQIESVAGGFQLLTQPAMHPWLARLHRPVMELKLSPSAMETLAIVAYRQPVMRGAIESIRGVQCGDVLTQLMEKGLIRISGRHDSLGRPVLYGTTRKFLQLFGLNRISDLPDPDASNP
ncbi:SMC-Scp complex subunit ScpB [Tuwongella immobilis]|uniref:SMC-Scp complex subunit ScpB n=1 Tax=Tuwongella immobilis TaxID=692036 RepID=A0A6C2YP60_9BACT|nr:SMC-Scp complex subunit ScpB [Tuwongella immobilis]VIP03184.1 segregation and condensation protein b : Chromosome segregation and condensation protein, ScpB OS=Planctomyces brasiliensis (strain ATCC 49424 / DSM 5305 / JCM 21570 / NBRC 103401 / IFAM 1448) GN=Plabr_3376 PE=4 SV=1: DUF387 [Tuwongella immobilis]VTS03639.1 segregation and condensation protein b : Chromosome segregation and condensation protein, ScpB OS=Planctomyces brasiliensis (strain ATCC 49424 / DSM 5305 / JCM 21570 / NBRC 10340